MTMNPLVPVALLAAGYGTAVICRRYGWFRRWNFMLLMLAAWLAEVIIFSIVLATVAALKS